MDEENDLIALLTSGDVEKAKSKFSYREKVVKEALQHYNIETHAIAATDKIKAVTKEDGSLKELIREWGLPIAYQQKIVQMSTVFLFGKPVKLIQESEGTDRAFDVLQNLWSEMRQNSKNIEVASKLFSETECIKKFVAYRDADADPGDTTKPNTVRCMVLAKSKGDTIGVRFNEFGGLEAISREYKVKTDNGIEVTHFDVETASDYYNAKNIDGKWEVAVVKNLTGKINSAYYSRDKWDSYLVDKVIERREVLSSRRANNNDAMGDPILVLEGEVIQLPDVKENAKVVVLQPGGKASYLYPQMAVDLIKEEREDLEKIINYITDTVDLSSDALRSLGQDSGKALIMKFFPAELKAIFNRIQFEEMLDREINILRAFITKVIYPTDKELISQIEKLRVKIEFSTPLPDNIDELINMLSTATGGKATLSQEEAANMNPLVKSGAKNWDKLKAEQKENSLTIEDSI